MAFKNTGFEWQGPRYFSYKTDDGIATVTAVGYFDKVKHKLRIGDLIQVTIVSGLGLITETWVDSILLEVQTSHIFGTVKTLLAGNSSVDDGRYSVLEEGARADFNVQCLPPFQRTVKKGKSRTSEFVIPENYVPGVAFPGYATGGNWLNSLPMGAGIAWTANTAYVVNELRSIAGSTLVCLQCSTPGTSGSVEPPPVAVNLVNITTVTDGTVVWTYRLIRGLTPGGKTTCRARIILQAGPIIVPGGHWWEGVQQLPLNNTDMPGSEILIPGGYTPGGRIVQLGYDDYPADGAFPQSARMERMTINGRGVAGVIGVYSNSAQESSGLFDVCILACQHGIIFEGAQFVGPANFTLERVNIAAIGPNSGNGANIYGTQYLLQKVTSVNTHTTTNGDSGVILRGSNGTLRGCHIEGHDFGVDIGGPPGGAGNDTAFWTFDMKVDSLTAFCLPTQPPLQAALRIRNVDTHLFNIELYNLGVHVFNKGILWAPSTTYAVGDCRALAASSNIHLVCTAITTGISGGTEPVVGAVGTTVVDGGVTWTYRFLALIQDDVNGIVIPATADNLKLEHYLFSGIFNTNSLSSVQRPVYTSFYDGLSAPNPAVKAMTVTGTVNNLNPAFPVGGNSAGILQITGLSAPILQGMVPQYTGQVVYLHYLSGVPASTLGLQNQAGVGTAIYRFMTLGGGTLAMPINSYARAVYGDARGAGDRWFVELV